MVAEVKELQFIKREHNIEHKNKFNQISIIFIIKIEYTNKDNKTTIRLS